MWILSGPTPCEPLEKYRCLWNSGNRIFTRFYESVFREEKRSSVDLAGLKRFMEMFDNFSQLNVLRMMIEATMKATTDLMDPELESMSSVMNKSDVGNRIDANAEHWYDINVIFQARRVWYKKMHEAMSVSGSSSLMVLLHH